MTASKQAKSAGLKSLAQLSEMTKISPQTLNNWAKHRPELFKILLAGAVSLSK